MVDNVSAVSCSSYNRDEVYSAVVKAITEATDFPDIKGKRVLVKPNLLIGTENSIDRGICTNPEVVYAVGKYVLENGGILEIADTPGGRLSPTIAKNVYLHCGIEKVAEELGISLDYNIEFSEVQHPDGKQLKSFLLIDAAQNADVIISVCKLKTHVLTHYTGAVKNTFGLIPGLHKSVMHRRFQTVADFADMLIDVNEVVMPDFVVMDAIVGMEGDGPQNGTLRDVGYILASSSVYATDVVAQKMIGFNPLTIPTTVAAINRNKVNIDEITTTGDNIIPTPDFKKPSYYDKVSLATTHVRREALRRTGRYDKSLKITGRYDKYLIHCLKIKKIFIHCLKMLGAVQTYAPHVDANKCTLCGACVRYCPTQSLKIDKGKVVFNKKTCVRCSGCQDACKNGSITQNTKPFGLGILIKPFRKYIFAYPKVIQDNCIGCAQCVNICSVDAVSIKNKKAKFNTAKCIRCYCCHEMCSYNAIEIELPLWKRIHK